MGLFKKTFYGGVFSGAGLLGYLGATTTIITPLPSTDPAWASRSYAKYNIHRNASMSDVCVKRIPLNKLKPALLEKEGDLVLELCRGVWSGWGYRLQRRYLARKYQGPATASQLWTVEELSKSTYEPGTQLTDHFEVVEKTPTDIAIRCGDSPRTTGPRDSDGVFVVSADVDEERGEATLALKSIFFSSSRKMEGIHGPVPIWIEVPHRWYARVLLEVASWRLTR